MSNSDSKAEKLISPERCSGLEDLYTAHGHAGHLHTNREKTVHSAGPRKHWRSKRKETHTGTYVVAFNQRDLSDPHTCDVGYCVQFSRREYYGLQPQVASSRFLPKRRHRDQAHESQPNDTA